MGEIIPILLGLIFMGLSLLHLAWALGVKWGFESSVPTDLEGNKVLKPKKIDCVIVGAGLGFFSALYFLNYLEISFLISPQIERIALWIVPSIFLLRAIGDFRYIGLFKKVKTTAFGKLDSRMIIPLCLAIAAMGVWYVWM